VNSQGTEAKGGTPRQAELWPLVRVIRICLRADVLSTGAVLVDLPGSQDSNVARAAVADSWTEQCTTQFILALSTRAVSDRGSWR